MLVAVGYRAPLERNLVFRPLRGNLEVFIEKNLIKSMKSIFPDCFGRLTVGDNFLFRKENKVS